MIQRKFHQTKINKKRWKTTENHNILHENFFKASENVWSEFLCWLLHLQKLEGLIFKFLHSLHNRGCFQKNVNSATVVKARRLFFFLFTCKICHAKKIEISSTQKLLLLRGNRCTLVYIENLIFQVVLSWNVF